MTEEIEKRKAIQFNNKVFAHFHIGKVFDNWNVSVDFYLVQDGFVYLINNGTKQKSGDSIFETELQCEMIGDFDEKMTYHRFATTYTFKQLVRKFHLHILLPYKKD